MATVPAVQAAEDEYFVEVGDDVAKNEAADQWAALVAKHKNLLGKLKFYPKDVMQGGELVTTRMQAGPIATKSAALKICNRLFAKDVPCFVIEGAGEMPATAMMHLNQDSQVAASSGRLPWLAAKADVAAAPEVKGEAKAEEKVAMAEEKPVATKGSSFLPWLFDEKEEEKKAEEKAQDAQDAKEAEADGEEVAKKKAQVQVAEAIRVPLTETVTMEDKIRVSALPELKPSFGTPERKDETSEMGNVNSGAGWLDVGNFVNEEIATSLWEEVRKANRKQAKNLNMRISPQAKGEDKTTLSVGPFANSAEALNFCRSGLQAGERGLRCSFVANDTGAANNKLLALNARSDAYAARRRPQQNPQVASADAAAAAKLAPAAGPSKQYWVQVVTADSQMQALKQWEKVKSANAEVIGDLRSSVSASATDKSSYVVRVGPIAENDQAIRVCSQLQKRNVECRVLLYSRGNI